MKLRRLTLQGFKSFADKTELSFHEGITAIVGPNGCGKSNISDAIRWVLGEQRPTAIRGSKMEEAIFQGTTQRRPVNRAEVSLAFDNEERRLPVEGDEVEIRRIVFREGGSDYQLNRNSVRLRDILDTCRDTGLGANAYTVIEQGMIDAMLSERPEERRHLFEEAAGIGRYKDRRKVAQRRLEAAETDLSRLNDLITEVEAKVRSLARQRKRAQKYGEYRARKLALEVAVAQYELQDVRATLQKAEAMLDAIGRNEPASRAALTTAEASLERLRLGSAEGLRERSNVAVRLEEMSRQISEHERTIAVGDERRAHAERRLEQITVERAELRARAATLEAELRELDTEHVGQVGVVQSLAEQVAEVQDRQAALRKEVTDIRRMDEDARAKENEITRQLARLEGDAANADIRAQEAESRLEHLALERDELNNEMLRLDEQRDLFAEQARDLAGRLESLRSEAAGATDQLDNARNAEADARKAFAVAEDRANHLASRVAALEALEREYHGFAPAVAHALTHKQNFSGLLGPVAEFLRLPADRAASVEGALGSLLQAIVVKDFDNIEQLQQWIDREDTQSARGAIALIPQESLPRLEALLETIRFVGKPPADTVLFGRREKLGRLRDETAAAERDRNHRGEQREAAGREVTKLEADLRDLQSRTQLLEFDLRRADADEANRVGQRGRTERATEELDRRHAELLGAIEKARSDAQAARAQRAHLETDLGTHRTHWQQSTETLTEREAAWEQVRDEEAELRVAHARAEGALAALDRRIQTSRDEHDSTGIRLGALDREAEDQSESRHRLELQKAEADAAERRVRERLEAEWGRPFEQLIATAPTLEETELRRRKRFDEEADEGDESDYSGEAVEPYEVESVSEPVETLPATVVPGVRAWKAELTALAVDIERLGPINMLAVEEYAEESQRLTFLQTQRDDLTKARDDLQNAIREINKTARELFLDTFNMVKANFHTTFSTLFEGGECDIRLEDEEDPLESPIDIIASPRGKRTQRIHLLSGGERALTALALLFAIYLVKPSPFCVLDEVDAPLDEANIGRFISMLKEFKSNTQFIVITHNPRTMEAADWLYGVTMEEAGISSIVGVRLDEVLAGASAIDVMV